MTVAYKHRIVIRPHVDDWVSFRVKMLATVEGEVGNGVSAALPGSIRDLLVRVYYE